MLKDNNRNSQADSPAEQYIFKYLTIVLQIAIKCNAGIVYCQSYIPLYILFTEKGHIAQDVWLIRWQKLSAHEQTINEPNCRIKSIEEVRTKFETNNIYLIAERAIQNIICTYISVCLSEDKFFFCEIRFELNFCSYVISTRSEFEYLNSPVSEAIQVILNN